LNWLDIIIIIVLAISVLGGWRTGLIKAALGWIGIIVGLVLAGDYYQSLAKLFSTVFQETLANILGFLAIFIGVTILSGVLGIWLSRVVSLTLLGWLNRLAGAAFGLFIGAVVIGALLVLWVKFLGIPGTVERSTVAPLLIDRFPLVLALLPDEFEVVRSFFR
jgi:membrane protein required for colicin V production